MSRVSASDIYRSFKAKAGSGEIATAHAIRGLISQLHRRKPRTILEIGAGIGTTTSVLISILDQIHGPGNYRLVSIEYNEFCIGQLDKNLGMDRDKVNVARRYEDIPGDIAPFEFVLVDGGGPFKEDRPEPDAPVVEQNCLYVSELAPRAVIFVENDRGAQRALFMTVIDRPWAYFRSRPRFSGTGYHLYQLDPTIMESISFYARHDIDNFIKLRWLGKDARRAVKRRLTGRPARPAHRRP